jgi:gliding motility-associated-like protein
MKKAYLHLLFILAVSTVYGQNYTVPSSGTTNISACSGTVRDPGGTGTYGNNANGVLVICPSTPGSAIQINFTQFDTESNYDYVTVFNGNSTGAPILMGPLSGGPLTPPGNPIVSTAANGCLTIRFTSDGSVTDNGFTFTISCVTLPTCTDGIQNGNETGIDCGGCSSCPPCSGSSSSGNASVTAASNLINLPCGGGSVNLSAVGNSTTPVLGSNFNGGTAGAGWSVSPAGQFSNPCGAGPNGAYMWMGNTTAAPRTLQTNQLAVPCGGTICFDLRFSVQGGASPCEGPDLPNEGVNLQYSNNCGATWTSIAYFHPNGTILGANPGTSSPSISGNTAFTTWNNYCFPIPAGAQTASTIFRWFQSGSSGTCCDHWGIDEVTINANPCAAYYLDWTHIPGAPDAANLVANVTHDTTFTVLYTNGIDDTASAQVSITLAQLPPATVTPTAETCDGANDGSVIIDNVAGSGPYTVTISGPVTQTLNEGNGAANVAGPFNNLPDGTYSYTVTGAGGCTTSGTFTIAPGPVCCSVTASPVDALCNGGSTGSATANPVGSAPFSYSWTGGQTTQTASGLTTGTYTVTLTDNLGCTATASATVNQPTALGGSATPTAVTCNGLCDGSISVSANGGTAPYQYSLNGGPLQAGTSFTGLCAGPHVITVQDANNCSFVINTSITQPTALSVSAVGIPATCGAANGQVNASGSGGTTTYQYSLNGGALQASGNFGTVPQGTHTVLVQDANGCTATTTVTVGNSAGPVAIVDNIGDVTCAGGVNGSVLIGVSAGTAPLTYALDGGAPVATNSFTGLIAGAHTVVVTDGNGCTSTVNFNINQPTQLTFVTAAINASCNGVCDGSITVTANNATPPYEYSSNNGLTFQTSNTLSGLCAGNINVVVRDAFGCLANAIVPITQPAAITGSLSFTDPVCPDACDGTVTVSAPGGGTAPFQYSIDGGAFQAPNVFNAVCDGLHSVIVQDANGCQLNLNTTLTDPPHYTLDTVYTDESNCGFNDGGFEVFATGGVAPYQFTNVTMGIGPQASGEFLNLVAGAYQMEVTDARGCVETIFVGVNDIQMNGILNGTTDASCFGVCDGTVSTIATAGNPPNNYMLDNGLTQLSGDFSGLCAGPHAITMFDNGFCIFNVVFNINEPADIAFTSSTVATSCNGGSDGSITINAPSGGTAPYEYSIDGGASFQVSPVFNGLPAGSYNLVVQDANFCQQTGTATITQPSLITFNTNHTDLTCFQNNTGTLQIVANGGTGALSYSITGGAPFAPGFAFFALAANTYTVAVQDANGCVVTGSVTINEPAQLTASGVPADASCFQLCDGEVDVTANGGTLPYQYSPDNGTTFLSGNVLTGICAGAHTIMVQDNNGCQVTFNTNIGEPTQLTYVVTPTSSTCALANGELDIVAANATPTYQYSIDNGVTFQAAGTFTGLLAGNYNVVVEDANGCQESSVETIVNDASPVITAVVTTDPLCLGDCNGTADVVASGGTGALQYSIDGGPLQAAALLTGLCAGAHTVEVVDANGCTDDFLITLGEPTQLTINATTTNLTCFNNSTGGVQITAGGGTFPYQYSFDGGVTNSSVSSISFVAAGTYNLQVTDDNGCVNTTTATVTEPAELEFTTVNVTDASCFQVCDGAVAAFPQGGTVAGLYTFYWSNGIGGTSQAQVTGVCAGTYTLVVEDDNACFIDTTFTINEPAQVQITSVVATDALCNGSCDGIITINAPTGAQYSIDNGASFQAANIFNGLCAGNYNVVVLDATGCEVTSNTTVYEPTPLTLSSTPDAFICFADDMTLSAFALGGTAPYNYSWSNGVLTQNQVVNPTVQTSYSVTATDANGCVTSAATTNIDVSPLFYATVNPLTDTICPGQSVTFTAQGFDGQPDMNSGSPEYIWEWNTGDSTASVTVSPLVPTTYTVIGKDLCGDYDTLTVEVVFYPNPQVDISADNLSGCAPLDVTFTNATPAAQVGTDCVWNISDGTTLLGCNTVSHTFTTPGCYDVELVVTSPYGCVGDSTFTNYICVYENPIADFSFTPTDPTIINSVFTMQDQSYNAAQWSWDFAGLQTALVQNPVFNYQPDTSGNYVICLSVISPDGCVDDTCKILFIAEEFLFYVPNAFTPGNGDGRNDVFMPVMQAVDPLSYEFMIFDRWGEMIFYTDNVAKGWDGTYKGFIAKQDVFVWKIILQDATSNEERQYLGHVTLLRE